MGNISVSVVIPTYKRDQTLPRAINSVLNQTLRDIEVIVVDDNDPTSKERKQTEFTMLQYAQNERVNYIKHPCNKNGSAARNTGIRAAKGKYIAFLDDDDEFMPTKMESQFRKLEMLDSSWAVCYTKYEIRNGDKLISKGVEQREGALMDEALMRNLFLCAGSNLMVRKDVLDEINGFDESFKRNQDLEILVRILERYKIAHCDTMGLIVYEHVGNKVDFEKVTTQYLQTFNSYIQRLPIEKQKKVYKMINLQRFRSFLFRRQFRECRELLKHTEISLADVIKYILHLTNRFIKKESVGYKLQ